MIIGLTGSFGSGKTTVANMFSRYGFKIINVDKLYHEIYNKNKTLKNQIKKEFGTINRNQLKKIVFNNSTKLKKLNNITHPIIIKAIKKEINKKNSIIKNNKKLINKKINIVIDIPLLFEAKIQNMFDKIIVVRCNKKEQIKRVLKKKKYSKIEIEHIIKSQMSLKNKIKRADFVVDNGKKIKKTHKQVKYIVNIILTKALKTHYHYSKP